MLTPAPGPPGSEETSANTAGAHVQRRPALNELVERESAFVDRIMTEVGKVIVGQTLHDRAASSSACSPAATCCSRACPASPRRSPSGRCATRSRRSSAASSSRPTCCRPTSIGTVIYNQQNGRVHRQARPDLREPRARRRDQPRARQGAERAARGDAGAAGHDRRPDLSRSPAPFIVMATQNPIEQEGTYPLPEAQVDRFMLHVQGRLPVARDERKIMERMSQQLLREAPAAKRAARAKRVVTPSELLERAQGRQPGLRRREDQGLHRRRRVRDARARKRGAEGPRPTHRVRRLAARLDRARTSRRARTRSCATAATSRPRT